MSSEVEYCANLKSKLPGQLLNDEQAPLIRFKIRPILVQNGSRCVAEDVGTRKELLHRKTERRNFINSRRQTDIIAFDRAEQIVDLALHMINARSTADRGLAIEAIRTPRKAHAGSDVVLVVVVERCACGADTGTVQCKHLCAIMGLIKRRVDFVTGPQAQREVRQDLPVILQVEHVYPRTHAPCAEFTNGAQAIGAIRDEIVSIRIAQTV